jgi:hypothetical protein
MDGRFQPNLGERSVDEVIQAFQAAIQDCAGRSRDANLARLQDAERQHGGAELVAHFVGEDPDAFGALLRQCLVTQASKFGYRLRDGIVDASIQGVKFIDRDRHVQLERQLRHRLTDVPVVVDDLRYRESLAQHFVAVLRGADVHRVARKLGGLQGLDELLDEERYAVVELRFDGARRGARQDLHLSPRDDLVALRCQEFVEHRLHLSRPTPIRGAPELLVAPNFDPSGEGSAAAGPRPIDASYRGHARD